MTSSIFFKKCNKTQKIKSLSDQSSISNEKSRKHYIPASAAMIPKNTKVIMIKTHLCSKLFEKYSFWNWWSLSHEFLIFISVFCFQTLFSSQVHSELLYHQPPRFTLSFYLFFGGKCQVYFDSWFWLVKRNGTNVVDWLKG